ncbi:MAG: hypothetical protein L3K10_04475 [Thermoplasmata archaeon]|nr:hypothetical protein [Thermoplasmata archaeon]
MKLSPRRLLRIRLRPTSKGDPDVAVDLIRLEPPNSWHTDQTDERDLAAVDYKLTALGPRKTRVDLYVIERWMTPDHPRLTDYVQEVQSVWDGYAATIEARFLKGQPAKG